MLVEISFLIVINISHCTSKAITGVQYDSLMELFFICIYECSFVLQVILKISLVLWSDVIMCKF
jgi:hypothetical protein